MNKQERTVHFNFGSHDKSAKDRLMEHKKRIERHLAQKGNGRVLIGIENPGISVAVAENAKNLTETGLLPTVSLFTSLMTEEADLSFEQVMKYLKKKPQEYMKFLKNTFDEFTNEELRILDEISLNTPGRVSMVIEGNSEKGAQTFTDPAVYCKYAISSVLTEQDTKKGAAFLKKFALEGGKHIKDREEGIANSIVKSLKADTTVFAFEGTYGVVHTPIAHEVKKAGYKVSYTLFDRAENGPIGKGIYFPPEIAIHRRARFSEQKAITDLELNQALFAVTLQFLCMQVEDCKNRNHMEFWESEEVMQRYKHIYSLVKKVLPTMEGVEQWSKLVTEKGFLQAFEEM